MGRVLCDGMSSVEFALVVIGAIVGLVLDSGGGMRQFFSMLLGGLAGYALAELRALRVRSDALERDVRGLAERFAAAQRQSAVEAARREAASAAQSPPPQPATAGAAGSVAVRGTPS